VSASPLLEWLEQEPTIFFFPFYANLENLLAGK